MFFSLYNIPNYISTFPIIHIIYVMHRMWSPAENSATEIIIVSRGFRSHMWNINICGCVTNYMFRPNMDVSVVLYASQIVQNVYMTVFALRGRCGQDMREGKATAASKIISISHIALDTFYFCGGIYLAININVSCMCINWYRCEILQIKIFAIV